MPKVKVGNDTVEATDEEIELINQMFDDIATFENKIKSIAELSHTLSKLNEFLDGHIRSIMLRKAVKTDYIINDKERNSTIKVLTQMKKLTDSLKTVISPFDRFHEDLINILGTSKSNMAENVQILIDSSRIILKNANSLIEKSADLTFE